MTRLATLVLAAGGARRMGRQKALTKIEGVPLVRRIVVAAVASRANQVFAVVGHHAVHVASAVVDLPVTIVDNPNWRGTAYRVPFAWASRRWPRTRMISRRS